MAFYHRTLLPGQLSRRIGYVDALYNPDDMKFDPKTEPVVTLHPAAPAVPKGLSVSSTCPHNTNFRVSDEDFDAANVAARAQPFIDDEERACRLLMCYRVPAAALAPAGLLALQQGPDPHHFVFTVTAPTNLVDVEWLDGPAPRRARYGYIESICTLPWEPCCPVIQLKAAAEPTFILDEDIEGQKIWSLLEICADECDSADIVITAVELQNEIEKALLSAPGQKVLDAMKNPEWFYRVCTCLSICGDECDSADVSLMADEICRVIKKMISEDDQDDRTVSTLSAGAAAAAAAADQNLAGFGASKTTLPKLFKAGLIHEGSLFTKGTKSAVFSCGVLISGGDSFESISAWIGSQFKGLKVDGKDWESLREKLEDRGKDYPADDQLNIEFVNLKVND